MLGAGADAGAVSWLCTWWREGAWVPGAGGDRVLVLAVVLVL